jgi:DNA recombination protein RmuC
MDFILFFAVINFVGILLLIWHIFTKQSTQPTVINHHEIVTPIKEQITDIVFERFDKMDSKQNEHNQSNLQTRTNLETRLGEIQKSLLEEVGKTQIVHSKSLSEIQTTVLQQLTEAIKNLNEANNRNFDQLSKTNHEKLTQIQGEVDKRMQENLAQHLKSFESVNKNIGEMQSTAMKMMDSTKSIDKLNTIFDRTNSKGFGQFSETYLESLLSQHLNVKDWQKQVGVPGTNDKIDFVINMGDKKIGIDSKFPITRYQDYIDATPEHKPQMLKEFFKSVTLMATEISKKYLQPGFLDTLLMFLPSDGMYSDIVNNQDIMATFHKLKVTPISPTTLFPIIVVINSYEFRLKVNENAEMIMQGLQGVRKNVDSFREEFRKLGDKIRQAGENYDKADRNLVGLQNNILKLEVQETNESQSLLEANTLDKSENV